MAHFYQWETTDLSLRISRAGALADIKNVIVSILQGNILIEKEKDDLGLDEENDIINLHLGQEETGKFNPGTAHLQVNLYYENTERDTSAQVDVQIRANLHKEVMA